MMANAYALSVILSAFLLFQIQPRLGKVILAWFGGTSAVWSTVLLFFQCVLTGGYAYAYGLLGRLRGRRQGIVHLIFLAISLGLLGITALTWTSPLTPNAAWRPVDSTLPVWGILRLLAVAVGVPYFLLASNSTLLQAWFGEEPGAGAPPAVAGRPRGEPRRPEGKGGPPRPWAAPLVGRAGGRSIGTADLGDESDHARGGRRPVPVGRAAFDLPADFPSGLLGRARI